MITSWKMQRIIAGLSQADLAHESGVGRYRVSLIERGIIRPTREEAAKLTQVLAYREAVNQHEAARA
jgi:transcriptional regulator with XRE-family HTH domain